MLAGRSQWITLLCEVLPRALLAELGLARILLGSSGGGQFLIVLPGEAREAAEKFLQAARRQISELSARHVQLIWGVTENLGRLVRRSQAPERRAARASATPLWPPPAAAAFQPFTRAEPPDADTYFAKELGAKVREASTDRLVAGESRPGDCPAQANTPGT